MMINKQAVIYVRVSDPSQIENNSLETQETTCLNFASRLGYAVIEIFREEGISAKNANRKALKDLLVYCYKNKSEISAVIVYRLSRFSRNTENALELEAYLAKKGIQVLSATEPITNDPVGKFIKTMLYASGQMDNEIKGLIVKDNMQSLFRKGIWCWGCPVGYKRPYKSKEENKGKAPIPVEELRPFIVSLFEDAAKGIYTRIQLADKMNLRGFKELFGSPSSIKTVNSIILNTFYYGLMYCKKWNEYAQGLHEPIVTEELWNRANNAIFGTKIKYKSQPSEMYPLKGLLKCEVCGKPMTSSNPKGRNKTYFHYECGNKQCRKTRISTEEAHTLFMQRLHETKPTERTLKLFQHMIFSQWDKVVNASWEESAKIDKRIENLNIDLKRISKDLNRGIYNEETAKTEAEEVNKELLVLRVARSDIKIEQYDIEKVRNFTEHFLLNLDNLWLRLEDLALKQALQSRIYPNGIICTLKREIRTVDLSSSFALIKTFNSSNDLDVTPRGFEPR